MKLAGILLIILGVAALIYGSVSFATRRKVVDAGPIQVNETERRAVPLPPILGIAAIVSGGLLAYVGGKKGS